MKKIVVIVTCLLLVACSPQGKKIATMSADIYDIKTQYKPVKQIVLNHEDVFSPEEMRILNNLDANVELIDLKLKTIKNLEVVQVSDIETLYFLAKNAYTKSREVVHNHLGEFSDSDKIVLSLFDQRVVEVGEQVDRLLTDPTQENLRLAARLIPAILETGFKIVMMLL